MILHNKVLSKIAEKKPTNLEELASIKELEEINNWFQSEEVDLNKGLAKFRRGLELIKKCRQRLKQVQNEFTKIKKEFAEEPS